MPSDGSGWWCSRDYYKAVLVGFAGGVLGIEWLGGTLIHGISTNHWIEIIVYCPLLWLALHQINEDVFDVEFGSALDRRANARRRLIGDFAIVLVIYGTGVHIANVIEIYSREQRGIEQGDVYNLVYFLDEGFSHYLQFVPLFFVIGWFVIHDRPRLEVYPTVALFLGAGHGVERAIGIIEGGKWFLGAPTVVWLGAAAWIRRCRLRRLGIDARDDFFFRYAFSFCVTLPIAQSRILRPFRIVRAAVEARRFRRTLDGDRRDRADGDRYMPVGGVGAVVESAGPAGHAGRARDLARRLTVEHCHGHGRPVRDEAVEHLQLRRRDVASLAPRVDAKTAPPCLVDEASVRSPTSERRCPAPAPTASSRNCRTSSGRFASRSNDASNSGSRSAASATAAEFFAQNSTRRAAP